MPKVPKFIHVLLESDDVDSAEYKAAVAQLERQPQWQPALEKLALGDSNWWPEAQAALADSGLPQEESFGSSSAFQDYVQTAQSQPYRSKVPNNSVTIEIESSLAQDTPIDCERVSLDFLEPPSHPELLGRIGRYEIERVLGTGGMGVVLRAFDTDLHRVVAIKVLASHLAHNSSARRRFAREAQAAAAVVHPNVIPIFNVESDAKTPYIVMHYVAGQSLQRRVDVDGPLPVVDALRIAQQTAAGLNAAHAQGLVHRDVKPANIMLEEKIDRVLLSDFGLARAVDDASLTKTGIVAGTPHYMSPEQALGENIDHRSDLFSLGSVLYFMLAGHPPFRASSAMAVLHRICQFTHRPLNEVNRDVPIEVSALVDRMLSKKPEQRLASAADAERELAQLLNDLQQRGLSIQSKPLHTPNPSSEWIAGANVWLQRAAVVLACVGLIVLGRQLPEWFAFRGEQVEILVSDSTIPDQPSPPPISLEEARTEYDAWLMNDESFQQSAREIRSEILRLRESLSGPSIVEDDFQSTVRELSETMKRIEVELENP